MMKTHTYLIIGFHNYKHFVVDKADKLLLIGIILNFLRMQIMLITVVLMLHP